MQVKIEEIKPCRVELQVEIDPKRVEEIKSRAFREVASYIQVPGFRKGKAPAEMTRRLMDASLLQRHTLLMLRTLGTRDALKETKIDAVGDPEFVDEEEQKEPEEGEAFSFTVRLNTPPHVELGPISGHRIEYATVDVTEEDVDRSIEQLRSQRTALVPVDRPAMRDDFVSIDAIVRTEGEEDRAVPMLRVAGSSDDPIDQAVLGHGAGETIELDAPIEEPESEGGEARMGRHELTIRQVRNWGQPERNDDFAKSIGFDSLDLLRVDIRARLEEKAREMADDDVEERLIDAILAQSKLTYPAELLDERAGKRMNDLLARLDQQGVTLEEYIEREEISLIDLEQQIDNAARRSIETQLLFGEILRNIDIQVTREDIAAEQLALKSDETVDEETLEDRAVNRIVYRRTMDYLKANNELVPLSGESVSQTGPDNAKDGGWASRFLRRHRREEAEGGETETGSAETRETEADSEETP